MLVKSTALVSVIGLTDMMHRAGLAAGATREPFTFYLAVAGLYLAITSVSLLLPIRIVVPAMLLLEVLTGLHLFWSTRREVHWTSIRPLLAGVALGTPVGLYVLIKAPAALLKRVKESFDPLHILNPGRMYRDL